MRLIHSRVEISECGCNALLFNTLFSNKVTSFTLNVEYFFFFFLKEYASALTACLGSTLVK